MKDWSLHSAYFVGRPATAWFALLVSCWLVVTKAIAVEPGAPLNGFVGAKDGVSLAVQPDGKVIGLCRLCATSNLVRWSLDGAVDPSFRAPAIGSVFRVQVQRDGKLLVIGEFSLSGRSCTNLVRLNYDGTLDTQFCVTAWDPRNPDRPVATVGAVAEQSDRKILVGGSFTNIAGAQRRNLVRLNSNGTLDSSFNPGFAFSPGAYVSEIAVQRDGSLLVQGDGLKIGTTLLPRMIRVTANGSVDSSFVSPLAPGEAGFPEADGGYVVVGSEPSGLGYRGYVRRILPDGAVDPQLSVYLTVDVPFPNFRQFVSAVALQADGALILGGTFDRVNGGLLRRNLVRIRSDGTVDETFPSSPQIVRALALAPDGSLLVAAYRFTGADGIVYTNLVRLQNADLALQRFGREGGLIRWVRGGALPAIERAWFEYSSRADGPWTLLGEAEFANGSWRLGLTSPPAMSFLRARGYVSNYRWLSEIVAPFVVNPAPVFRLNAISPTVVSNRFQATLDALPQQSVLIEESVDLIEWTPSLTNGVSFRPTAFEMSTSTTHPRAFFRAAYWP